MKIFHPLFSFLLVPVFCQRTSEIDVLSTRNPSLFYPFPSFPLPSPWCRPLLRPENDHVIVSSFSLSVERDTGNIRVTRLTTIETVLTTGPYIGSSNLEGSGQLITSILRHFSVYSGTIRLIYNTRIDKRI